jgi:hypothetical protein
VFVATLMALCAVGVSRAPLFGQDAVPHLPSDVPIRLVGHPGLDGSALAPYRGVRFAMGRVDKSRPATPAKPIDAVAYQTLTLRADRLGDREVWIRSVETARATGEVLGRGEIVLDRRTLAPVRATVERGGTEQVLEYDWDLHEVRQVSPPPEPDAGSERLDLKALEAATHETWMAVIPWSEGLRVMIPTILAGGGGKWWAVPHVVGSDMVDVGDGVERSAWVIDVDWWGMGADHATFTPGGRPDGTAGPGGKYWVLRDPPPGMPPVVRVQTEVDGSTVQVIQMQDGVPEAG